MGTLSRKEIKTLEKVGFSLIKTEMYQDMHDESKCMTNFYELVL